MEINVFSLFLGLYIQKMDIPDWVMDYLSNEVAENFSRDEWMIFTMIKNSPDMYSPELRSLILPIIRSWN